MNPRLNRREFLGATAVALVSPLTAAESVPFRLGFSLYGMKAIPVDRALETLAKIGYQDVEFACMSGWPTDPAQLSADKRREIRQLLAKHQLQLAALMENCPLDVDETRFANGMKRLESAAELGAVLSPDRPPIIETILGGKPGEWADRRKPFAERIRRWAKLAEQTKSTICLKAHRFGAVNRPEQVRELADSAESDRIRVAFDWSHFEQRDIKIDEALKTLLPATRFIHVKDTLLDEKGTARFVLPGEGKTDYADLFRRLRDGRYAGSVCVEVSGMVFNAKGYDADKSARSSFATLDTARRAIQ